MTEAEKKAKELVDRFLLPITQRYIEQSQAIGKGEINIAKQCAIIAVEEIIKAIEITTGHCELRRLDEMEVCSDIKYWNEVLTQIKNIK